MPHPEYNGQPLPVYSVGPNWKNSISLRTIYATVVKEALDLGEERQGRVPRSLFGIKYTTLPLTGQETGYIRRMIELAQALPIVMPVWTDASKLSADVSPGALELPVDDSNPTLLSVLHDYVILWKDYKTWEVLAVDDIGSGTEIALADEVVGSYPAGTFVIPILIGKLPRLTPRNITDEHGVASPDFEETFNGLTDQSVVEVDLPPLDISYTDACRAEFIVTADGLEPETVYTLEASLNPADGWAAHILFALTTPEELASGIKQIIVNNDYNGEVFFRTTVLHGAAQIPMTTMVAPLASVIAPPEIDITNLSEITTQAQLTAIEVSLAGASVGLRPLDFYSDGGLTLPYSAVEDALTFTSLQYRRFQKKFGWRQWSYSSVGDLLGPTSGGEVVSVTGPGGATIKWTRDLTDPTLATPAPLSYNAIANNAYVQDNTFTGIIKARCFKDGCRSPLAMVAVDKVMIERPVFNTFGTSNDAGSYCDKPNPVDGSESGQSCNLLYGGECGFEAINFAAGTAGGSIAGGGTMLQARGKSLVDSNYLGWPIHGSHSSHYDFANSTWLSWFNGWLVAHENHSWAITTLGVIETQVDASLAGVGWDSYRAAWDIVRDIEISGLLPIPPGQACGVPLNYTLDMARFDIVRSPLYYVEMRELFWSDTDFSPPPDASDPPGPIPIVIPYDQFETYTEGDKIGDTTLDFHAGTDWDGNWAVLNGAVIPIGFDKFDGYADGLVPEWTAFPPIGYDPFDGGEAWEVGDEWRRNDPLEFHVFRESWDGIPDGALGFDVDTEGTGFMTNLGEGWVFGNSFFFGVESWDGYADGAFVPAATGTNFVSSDPWFLGGATAKYWRVLITVSVNPSGNHIGVHEFEMRDVALGTNWAAASNGGIATASSEFSGTYAASKAIDGNATGANNGWANNGTSTAGGLGWLRIELPTPKWIKEYKIGHYAVDNTGPSPAAWNFEYSYDGTIWMGQLSQPTGQGPYTLGELKTFNTN